jgi:hypothetical protein
MQQTPQRGDADAETCLASGSDLTPTYLRTRNGCAKGCHSRRRRHHSGAPDPRGVPVQLARTAVVPL